MEQTFASSADTSTKGTGGIYAEAPIPVGGGIQDVVNDKGMPVLDSQGHVVTKNVPGTVVGRAFTRIVLQPSPTASTLYDVRNYQGFEWMAGASRIIGVTGDGDVKLSAVAAVWWGTRFATGDQPDPLHNAHFGWGVGLKASHSAGHRIAGICGQDSSIGDDGAVQCRTWGKIILPKTADYGSIYFDILGSFLQPQATVVEGDPAHPPVVHFVANVGVGVNVDQFFKHGQTAAQPPAKPAAATQPKQDARFGPPSPAGL